MPLNTLKSRENKLSDTRFQLEIIEKSDFLPFGQKLKTLGFYPLKPTGIEILQINVGKLCNQTCSHCHVDAGPDRTEIMTRETLEQCLIAAQNSSIHTIDITGGAPEMNPHFRWFVEELYKLNKKVIVRSNLTILTYKNYLDLPEFFAKHKVEVVSSLPCYTLENVDKQRGNGVFERSITALKRLNELGYGKANSGLNLNLVYNPGGASLPGNQAKLEADYKRELKTHFDIEFNQLFTITNLPISRFLDFLIQSGKYEQYMNLLIEKFNPSAAMGVMCRNTLSVGWDGALYDCDFNQMLDLKIESSAPQHIKDFSTEALVGREIVIKNHCYGCTAGEGSSCQGSLV